MEAPKQIYLQLLDDDGNEVGEVTWSEDSIYKHDVKYVRWDFFRVAMDSALSS